MLWTGHIKFATKFVTPRRKCRRRYKIYVYVHEQHDELSRLTMSVCRYTIYTNQSLSFWDMDLKFCIRPFLLKKLFICRNCRYRIKYFYGKLFKSRDIFTNFGMYVILRQATIAYTTFVKPFSLSATEVNWLLQYQDH